MVLQTIALGQLGYTALGAGYYIKGFNLSQQAKGFNWFAIPATKIQHTLNSQIAELSFRIKFFVFFIFIFTS